MVIFILLVIGLAFGSFTNALVWRIHELGSAKHSNKAKRDLSMLHGRSMCPRCHHRLAWNDLIPVLSWLSLRGKCRYCHKPIQDNPLVELVMSALFLISYSYWPLAWVGQGTVLFVFWLALLVGLVALAVYDLYWYLLPDKIMRVLAVIALAQAVVLMYFEPSFHRVFTIVLSALIGGGIFYVLFQISKGSWIGGGDVKLGGLLGLILADGNLTVITIFVASLIGTVLTLPLLLSGKLKRTSKVPFGPMLIAGAIIARLFGASLIAWYKRKLLLY